MLTVRRGIARVGWVLLALWSAVFAFVVIYSVVTQAPGGNLTQGTATFVGVPLAIFLLWRLLLWIGQGFWKHPAAPTKPALKEVHPGNKSTAMDDEKPWARLAFGAAGISFIGYGVYLGRLPIFPGFSGMIIYLGVFASIAQLIEWIWFSIKPRHRTY